MNTLMSFIFFSVTLLISLNGLANTEKGCVISWKNNRPNLQEVVLPAFSSGLLANELVSFSSIPNSITPTTSSLCFDENDDRLAYIHSYYYASTFIAKYNEILRELNLPILTNVKIRLVPSSEGQFDDTGGWANAKTNEVTITYHQPAFDETVLLHEIGHLFHYNFNGASFPTVLDLKIKFEGQFSAVDEAFADLLVSLFLDRPGLFFHTLGCDFPRSVDTFIHIPNSLKSVRELLMEKKNNPNYKKLCPKSNIVLDKILNGEIPIALDIPEPHYASQSISQPIWLAAQRFGNDEIKKQLLITFEQYRFNFIEEFLFHLLDITSDNYNLHSFLENAYKERGIDLEP